MGVTLSVFNVCRRAMADCHSIYHHMFAISAGIVSIIMMMMMMMVVMVMVMVMAA